VHTTAIILIMASTVVVLAIALHGRGRWY
jgi:hypothetical protein